MSDQAPEFDLETALANAAQEEFERALERRHIAAAHICAMPAKEIKEFIPNLAVSGGLTVLAGHPKAGKSTFLYHALAALANNGEFLGDRLVRVPVLYASEQSMRILREQLIRVPGMDAAKQVFFIPAEEHCERTAEQGPFGTEVIKTPYKTWGEYLKFWEHEIRETRAQIFVLDTLVSFLPLNAGGINDATISIFVNQLKNMALTANPAISIILVHHMRKGNGEQEQDMRDMAGSFALRAATDMNVALYTMSAPGYRRLQVESRLRVSDNSFRAICLDERGYHLHEGPPAAVKAAAQLVEEDAQLSARELADKYKISRMTAYRAKREKFGGTSQE